MFLVPNVAPASFQYFANHTTFSKCLGLSNDSCNRCSIRHRVEATELPRAFGAGFMPQHESDLEQYVEESRSIVRIRYDFKQQPPVIRVIDQCSRVVHHPARDHDPGIPDDIAVQAISSDESFAKHHLVVLIKRALHDCAADEIAPSEKSQSEPIEDVEDMCQPVGNALGGYAD